MWLECLRPLSIPISQRPEEIAPASGLRRPSNPVIKSAMAAADARHCLNRSADTATRLMSSRLFSLSVAPSSQTVTQGGSVAFNVVTSTTSGTAQTVSCGVSNLPSGLSATFSPGSVTTGSQSTLAISASGSAPVGTYTLLIAAASSYTTHTFQISVSVAQAQTGPAMAVTPSIVRFNDQTDGTISSPQTVVLRNSGTGQLVVTGIGLASGNADYALNLPQFSSPLILNQGVTYSLQVYFEPTATGTRPGQIVIYDNAPGSPQVVSLTGNGLTAQSATGTINVNATLNGVALPALYFYQYSLTGSTTVTGYDNNSFAVTAGTYSLSFGNNPSYFTLASVTPASSQSVVVGGTTTFTLTFTSPNDFYPPFFGVPSGSDSGSAQIVSAGQTATYYAEVPYPTGNASTPIMLSVAGVPGGAVATFSPEPSYGSSTLTIATDSVNTPAGVYALTLSGTNSSGLTHVGSTSSLAVTAPPSIPVQLVSQSSNGVQGNWGSSIPSNSVSADGRLITFVSTSTNIVSSDTSGNSKVLVRDLQSGTTSEASVSTSGVPADSDSSGGGISANGQFVVFTSSAGNLYPGSVQSYALCGVYVRDSLNGITEREDVAPDGTTGNADSCGGAAISADGRFVAFVSDDTNVISGASGMQVYLRDRKTGQTSLISSASDGSTGNAPPSGVAMSEDGRYIAFTSSATNLVPQNTNGLNEAFVRDTQAGVTSLVSISSEGLPANASISLASSPLVSISADGRFVAFASPATNLAPHPTDYATHVFLYDRQVGNTVLVDVDSIGSPLGGGSFSNPAISADGRFIAFWGFLQFVVRDMVEGQTAVISLASNGQPDNNTTGDGDSSVSMGGPHVAFASFGTNLVVNDTNSQADAFAATNPFVGSVSLQSITLNTPSTSGGSTLNGTVTLTDAAPTGGAVVSLWSNNEAAQPPAEVAVPAGSTSAQFSLSTSLVPSETVMTIMAAYNGGSAVTVLTLEPAAELTASPQSWDFGYQSVGTISSPESFTLTNSGTATLSINSVQLATGQTFAISANTCTSGIAAGASCSVSVTFNPIASGSTSDALQVSFGNPTVVQSITVTGNGATPAANLAPSTMPFGNVTVGGSIMATATLSNSGNAALSGISVGTSGPNVGDFSISSNGCAGVVIPANSSCLITVKFSPQATGIRSATLVVSDNAAGSPQTIGLTGIGATPITPYLEVNGGVWQQAASVAVNVGDKVNLGPWPTSGGSWNWAGPDGFTSTSRQINGVPLTSASNVFIATYANSQGATSSQTFTITVSPTSITPYIQVNGGAWQAGASASVPLGAVVNLGPQPQTGGTWSWTGPGGFTSMARELDGVALSAPSNVYTATFINAAGVPSTLTFTITVNPTTITPYLQVNGGAWQNVSSVTVNAGAVVNLGPQPQTGGTWSWTGTGGFTSMARELDGVALSASSNVYTATFTNAAGVPSTLAFTITVNPTTITPYLQVNGGAWQNVSSVTVNAGAVVNLGPQPQTGGTWSWTGTGGFTSMARELDGVALSASSNVYTATFTNAAGVPSTEVFTISYASTPITPYSQDEEQDGGDWQATAALTISPGDVVNLGPQPQTGGTWSWSGPAGFTSSSRQINNILITAPVNVYTATFTNAQGATSTKAFTITVGPSTITPFLQVNGGGVASSEHGHRESGRCGEPWAAAANRRQLELERAEWIHFLCATDQRYCAKRGDQYLCGDLHEC